MKLKKKNKNKKNKTKENTDHTDATSQPSTSQLVTSYPEEHNPFAEEDLPEEEEKDSKKKKKKKKEKLKKEKKRKGSKKVKKLKGKRERAVSRAVLEEINTNNNSNKQEIVKNPGRSSPHGSISNGNSPPETRTKGSFLAVNQRPRDKSPSRVAQLKQEAVTSPKVTSSEPGAEKITLKPSRHSSGDLKKLRDLKKTNDDVTRDVASTSQPRKVTIDEIEEIEEPKRERAVTRKGRTASVLVSSRERRKKKRLRLAKKWKRIKGKKKKDGDDSESLKNFNPKPANRNNENQKLEKLRHQVDEVKTMTQYNVVEELHKRESALIELEKNTATLEKFAESFAKTGHDIQLKKKAQNRCCGIFSGCRACWYICACDRGLKKKNIQKKLPPPSRANADAYEDDDVSYQTTLLRHQNETTMTSSKQKSTDTSSVDRKLLTDPSVTSSTSSIVHSVRNSRLFARLSRTSLASAEETTRSDSRCHDKQDRKYSSTGAIHDIIKKNNKTVSRDAKKSIKRIASQFDDEERMKRATELLLLDHE